jgi:hypothetical protein
MSSRSIDHFHSHNLETYIAGPKDMSQKQVPKTGLKGLLNLVGMHQNMLYVHNCPGVQQLYLFKGCVSPSVNTRAPGWEDGMGQNELHLLHLKHGELVLQPLHLG